MSKIKTEYWLGNEASLAAYIEALQMMQDPAIQIEARAALAKEPQDVTSPLLEVQGDIGIINIGGPLLSHSNEMTRWFGLVGYPDIREALVEAANNSDVKEILLNIDSPGGSANGVEDISTLISSVRSDFKPVHAYTSGTMASAAYWIGASAETVTASRLSTVGSIGVIATHFDITKSLEQEGVTPTVFRAGEFKALGGPYETLSDKAKEIIQSRLDTLYSEFTNHIANVRGTSADVVHQKMADGRDFLGFEAMQAGLVDHIASLDEMVANMRNKNNCAASSSTSISRRLDSSDTPAINMEVDPMARKQKILDEKTVAILAAGGQVEEVLEAADDVVEEAEETPAEVEETAEAVVLSSNDSLVTHLKSEISALNEKNTSLMFENRDMQAKLSSMESVHSQLRTVAEDVVNVRLIALGRSSMDMSKMNDEVLVQQYAQVTEEFHRTFPVGGRASLPSTEKSEGFSAQQARAVKASKIK